MVEAVNPYSAPTARVEDVEDKDAGEAERIRCAHIQHEASIRSIGLLYYLGGAGCVVGAAVVLVLAGRDMALEGLLIGALGAVYLALGWGIRALKRWGRNLSAVFSALGVLAFPLGTLINGYILWLIFSQKGKTVFSPEYQQVVAATPQVKYKTSTAAWIVLLVGLVLLGVIVVMI